MRFRPNYVGLFAVATILTALSPSALAYQNVYEGFSLTFPTYNTGTGFSAPWTVGGFNASAAGYTASDDSLSFSVEKGKGDDRGGKGDDDRDDKTGLKTSGGSVAGGAFSAINGATRNLTQPLGANGTTMFVSFLIRPQGTLNQGIFNGFFGLTLNGSLGNDLFIGKPGGGAQEQYVLETRGGSGQVPSGANTVVGRTAFLVVKAQFLPGNDEFTLYVNPAPGGSEPFGGVVKKDLDLGTVSKIGIYSSGAFAIDEIRIGSSFADVVPKTAKRDEH